MKGLVVGLTGGIATGKSSVATMFEKLGSNLIDSDKLSHAELFCFWEKTKGSELSNLIGVPKSEISDSVGRLDHKKLARIVFGDTERRKRLEEKIHPMVASDSRELIDLMRRLDPSRHIVYESALLVETGRYNEMDRLVVVFTDDQIRIERLMRRNSLTKEEALARITAQMSQEEKVKLADFVIDNSKSLSETEYQVAKVWEALNVEVETRP